MMPYPAHSNYPDGCTAADIDALANPPVDVDGHLSAKLRVLRAALKAAENAVADLVANDWGDVLLDGVEASELLANVATDWTASAAAEAHAEREADYLDSEAA